MGAQSEVSKSWFIPYNSLNTYLHYLGDKSFQAITCTGTDNFKTNMRKDTEKKKPRKKQIGPRWQKGCKIHRMSEVKHNPAGTSNLCVTANLCVTV